MENLIEEVKNDIKKVLAQFKHEEMGNRITQFSFIVLEQLITEQLDKLKEGEK